MDVADAAFSAPGSIGPGTDAGGSEYDARCSTRWSSMPAKSRSGMRKSLNSVSLFEYGGIGNSI